MTANQFVQYLDSSAHRVVNRIPLRASRLVVLFTASHVVAYLLQLGPFAQLPTAFLLYLLCPGLLLLDLLDIEDTASRISLIVASSLGCNLVLVTFLLYLGAYSPTNGVLLVASVSIVLALAASTLKKVEESETEVVGDA